MSSRRVSRVALEIRGAWRHRSQRRIEAAGTRYGVIRVRTPWAQRMGAVDAFLFALEVIWARCVLAYRLLFALLRPPLPPALHRFAFVGPAVLLVLKSWLLSPWEHDPGDEIMCRTRCSGRISYNGPHVRIHSLIHVLKLLKSLARAHRQGQRAVARGNVATLGIHRVSAVFLFTL